MSRQAQISTVSAGAGSTLALPINQARKSLIISAPVAGRVSFAFGQDAVLDSGLTLGVNQQPLVLTETELGDALKWQVNCIGDVGGRVVAILETFGP